MYYISALPDHLIMNLFMDLIRIHQTDGNIFNAHSTLFLMYRSGATKIIWTNTVSKCQHDLIVKQSTSIVTTLVVKDAKVNRVESS